MRVVVVGTGHVGLLTAATLSAIGHDVVGIDEDEEKIEGLTKGISPFFEPGLSELIDKGATAGTLRFEVAPEAVGGADVLFICVGTPARVSGEANLVIAGHCVDPRSPAHTLTVPASCHSPRQAG
jgi:UDP-glucose 6-dehydrogenase